MKWLRASAGLAILACLLCFNSYGQGFSQTEARVSSVTGVVQLASTPTDRGIRASKGQALSPGSKIDTTGGGKAVVSLTDGSIVVIQPGSVVVFRDFHQAGSLRELFEITLGQVRVKINHFAGKPNPYRMNSPTASVAVRGTEFSISVDRTGATRVIVFEGAVEVTSLSDPSRRTLIERGQGVLVAPGFDFQLFTPSAGDLDNRGRAGGDRQNGKPTAATPPPSTGNGTPPAQAAAGGTPAQAGDHDQQTPRAQAGTYERYIAGLESLNALPLLLRYNAVPEAYLDSAENPAYATGFSAPEGRLYALPTIGGTPESLESPAGSDSYVPGNFAGSSELAGFIPFGKGKFVFGGTATATYVNNTAGSAVGRADPGDLGPIPNVGSVLPSGKSISRFFDESLLVASKIGGNSFGLQVETLKGTGSLISTTPDPDVPGRTLQDNLKHSDILQTRLTLGFQRNIASRHTLGLFVRYGFVDAKNQDVFNTIRSVPQPLSQTDSPGHTFEVGLRLRGQIAPRLQYGIEAASLGLSLRDAVTTTGSPATQQGDRANRQSIGFGLLYQPGRSTMLAGDFAFGISDVSAVRRQDGNSLLLQNGTADSNFESLHLAVQQEIGSRFFLLASFMNVWQSNSLNYLVYPNSGAQPFSDALFSTSPASYLSPARLSDFGGGVRLSKNLLAQYIFSTDYGFNSSSHTLMLRYTLRPKQ